MKTKELAATYLAKGNREYGLGRDQKATAYVVLGCLLWAAAQLADDGQAISVWENEGGAVLA